MRTGPFVGQFGVNTNDRAVREMMQAFEQAMRPSGACQPSQQSSPQSTGDVRLNVDAVETDDAYTYWADVPGLEKSDLKVRRALELPASIQELYIGPTLCSAAKINKTADGLCNLQIQVNQQQRQLTVSGERSEPQVAGSGSEANDRKKFERRFGKFSRTVQLPKEADLEGISARVDKGVLKITVFKKISDSNSLQDITID